MKNNIYDQLNIEDVINTYSHDLYKYGVWLTKNSHDAEDLVQETFLRAWMSLDSLKNPAAIKSWLITILRRENARRFEKKRPELTSSENEFLDNIQEDDYQIDFFDISGVRKAIMKMDINYSEPLVLQTLYGYKSKEIGKLLGIKEGAVMTRLFRARKILRTLYIEDEVDNP